MKLVSLLTLRVNHFGLLPLPRRYISGDGTGKYDGISLTATASTSGCFSLTVYILPPLMIRVSRHVARLTRNNE